MVRLTALLFRLFGRDGSSGGVDAEDDGLLDACDVEVPDVVVDIAEEVGVPLAGDVDSAEPVINSGEISNLRRQRRTMRLNSCDHSRGDPPLSQQTNLPAAGPALSQGLGGETDAMATITSLSSRWSDRCLELGAGVPMEALGARSEGARGRATQLTWIARRGRAMETGRTRATVEREQDHPRGKVGEAAQSGLGGLAGGRRGWRPSDAEAEPPLGSSRDAGRRLAALLFVSLRRS